jgi:hypothetical protein
MSRFLIGAVLLLVGCGENAQSPAGLDALAPDAMAPDAMAPDALAPDALAPDASVDASPRPDATPDAAPGDPYDPDRVLRVAIELDPADWDALRHQERSDWVVFAGDDCLSAPFPSPFTWFEAHVEVDGQAFDRVALRKKGFLGSLDSRRPSLKLKFDKHIEGQRLGDRERLTLNNAVQDPAVVRQCLGYAVFAAAGVPAPRCGFAQVIVNGETLGVYANVEPVKKRFLRRAFGAADGALFEGTLSDFTPAWRGTFERKTGDPGDTRPLDALVEALARPDGELLAAVEAVVDVDAYLRYWAVESVLAAFDSYSSNTNNFFVYQRTDTGRFSFIPWGLDEVFPDEIRSPQAQPVQFAEGRLAQRLYRLPEVRARYFGAIEAVLDETWDDRAMADEVSRMAALAEPHLAPTQQEVFADAVGRLSQVIDGREAHTRRALQEVMEVDDEVRDVQCLRSLGEVSARFDVGWDTLDEDPFEAGTGALEVLLDGAPLTGDPVGGHAGLDDGAGLLVLHGGQPDGQTLALVVTFDHAPGATGARDTGDAYLVSMRGDAQEVVAVLAGTRLELHAAGERLVGVLVAELVAAEF